MLRESEYQIRSLTNAKGTPLDRKQKKPIKQNYGEYSKWQQDQVLISNYLKGMG